MTMTRIFVPLWAMSDETLESITHTMREVFKELYLDDSTWTPNKLDVTFLHESNAELSIRLQRQTINGYFRNGVWVQPLRRI